MRHDMAECLRDVVLPLLKKRRDEGTANLMDELLWFITPKPMEIAPKAKSPGQCTEILAWCPDDSAVKEGDWRVIWWEPAMGVWFGDRDLEEKPVCWLPCPYPPPRKPDSKTYEVRVICGVCRKEIARDGNVWRHISGNYNHSAEPEVAP